MTQDSSVAMLVLPISIPVSGEAFQRWLLDCDLLSPQEVRNTHLLLPFKEARAVTTSYLHQMH